MIRDRSIEFHQKAAVNTAFNDDTLTSQNISRQSTDLFFAEIDEIRGLIVNLARDVEALKDSQSNILAQTTIDQSSKNRLNDLIASIRDRSSDLKPKMYKMKMDVENDRRRSRLSQRQNVNLRMRQHHVEILVKKLYNVLEQYSQTESDYRSRSARRIKCQLDLAGERLSDAEINEIIDSNNTRIFNRNINPVTMQSVLDDVSARSSEIKKIEQSIGELNEMYTDMRLLLNVQDETVEYIDENIEIAKVNINDASKQTRTAYSYKKSSSRKKLIVISVFIVILIFLVIALLIFFLTY